MDDPLSPPSVAYLEELYQQYLENPSQVVEAWRRYFERMVGRGGDSRDGRRPTFRPASIFYPASTAMATVSADQLRLARLQERVDMLIRNYRVRGHIFARVDPLGRVGARPAELDYHHYGLTEADLDRPFSTTTLRGSNLQTLRAIIGRMEKVYCGAISAQFMHIDDLAARDWLQRRMENPEHWIRLARDQQMRIFTKLTDAVIFEEFVRAKYVGAKTFSLEGAETLIPLLDLALDHLARQGVREVVMGMSHRGRLNVLANILGKNYHDIFREFEDVDAELFLSRGDVKYHLGHHGYYTTASGRQVHISLGFNPSHLEFVTPVTLGRCRGKQDRFGDSQRTVGVALLIHGDAAFAGEGVVQESLNLSQLAGYTVGGTVHIIVNNQLGFTTLPEEGRSSVYATDVAKMLQIPVFHVNGEAPEAVAQALALALDFRAQFHRDVVIDMYCYRRWGHNEGDEPTFTQPRMYEAIERRDSVRDSYLKHLLRLGGITQAEADQIARCRCEELEKELSIARRPDFVRNPGTLEEMWQGYMGHAEACADDVETGVARERLAGYLERLTELPQGFHLHRKLERVLEARRAMAAGERPLDWAAGEMLALASLAAEGFRVRLSGQDAQRGTFSHRHGVLHDTVTGETCTPLERVSAEQANVELINSPLSEAGVLGFEYGYSLVFPDALVIWEAQFGDFANAAQVIIDQFIASAEDKWRHLSGLVMLLPHGFEGAGPEHSSARVERFLMLAAEDNLQVVHPSTPAQLFHVLRRQGIRPWRKPLVVLTPKSLLRHPQCVSPLDDFTHGTYQRVIPDERVPAGAVDRVLLCSGKLVYDLLDARERLGRHDVAIVRLEQFYPLPESALTAALQGYPETVPVRWVQEEPENMGAWYFLKVRHGEKLLGRHPFSAVTRPPSASPATGSGAAHKIEQQQLVSQALVG